MRTRVTTKFPPAPPAPFPGKVSSGSDSRRSAVTVSPAATGKVTTVVSVFLPGSTRTRPSGSLRIAAPAFDFNAAGTGVCHATRAGNWRAHFSAATAWTVRPPSNLALRSTIS